MLHSVTVPREVLGTDVRVDYVYSGKTFKPVVISAGMEYDHESMNEDVINYILDMATGDSEADELEYLESRVDGYIESMIDGGYRS